MTLMIDDDDVHSRESNRQISAFFLFRESGVIVIVVVIVFARPTRTEQNKERAGSKELPFKFEFESKFD